MIHTVKGFSIYSQWSRSRRFLEFLWFLYDPANVGNLISGSSAFSKSSLCIWKFSIHILLRPSLKDFLSLPCYNVKWVQLYSSLNILWHCPSLGLEWKLTFSSPVVTAEFSKFAALTALSFRILNNSVGIPLPPLAFFIVMLPKAHLTSHCRMPGPRWVIKLLWLSGSLITFCIVLLCILATSS